jgi:hypothetical protein
MNGLPFVDEHSVHVSAPPARVWPALVSVLRTDFGSVPAPAAKALLGIEPAKMSGRWREQVSVGDSLPGFEATEVSPATRLALEGRHRFSRYALIFELREQDDGLLLSAQTWAEFPGLKGCLYRTVVIGSRGHRILVRRLLARVARRA